VSWSTLTHDAGTPIRNPHHRAFPWPADTLAAIPVAPCYVMARDPRPWHRVMVVVACGGSQEISRVRAGLEIRGWEETRAIYGRPKLRGGWLYVSMTSGEVDA